MQYVSLGLPRSVSVALKKERFVETKAYDIDDLASLAEIDARTNSYRFELMALFVGEIKEAGLYPHRVSVTGFRKPVIVLYDPAKYKGDDCTKWHKAGAVQVTPYKGNAEQVTSSIWALMRLLNNHSRHILEFGDLKINTESAEAYVRGERVKLNRYEYELLEFLALRNGRGARRDEILRRLYGNKPIEDEPEEKVIDVWVCRIRKMFKKYEIQDVSIVSDWGRGYRFKSTFCAHA